MTAVFSALETEDATKLFIPEGALDYPGAAFHLNERGNELAARVIGAAIAHELAVSNHVVNLPDAAITP